MPAREAVDLGVPVIAPALRVLVDDLTGQFLPWNPDRPESLSTAIVNVGGSPPMQKQSTGPEDPWADEVVLSVMRLLER